MSKFVYVVIMLTIFGLFLFVSQYVFAQEEVNGLSEVIDTTPNPSLPAWIENNFNWYAQEEITEDEILN